jgi:hypothetical protein
MKLEIELPEEIMYLFRVRAAVYDESIPETIQNHLIEYAEGNLADGGILSEEVARIYKETTKNEQDTAA